MNEKVVVKLMNDGWHVKSSTAKRAARITQSAAEAIQIGRRIAINKGFELVIYREDSK